MTLIYSKQLIKALRVKSGLTQREIASKLEIHYQRISEWENGHFSPTLENFVAMCKKLNINPKELF